MVCLNFLSDSNCPSYEYISWLWLCGPSYILRLSDISIFPLLWFSESYYISLTDILWYDFHKIHAWLLVFHPEYTLRHNLAFFPSPCNARHACTMTLTLHLIMSLHDNERGPIKPAHCTCKHDICPVKHIPDNTLWAQLLGDTRYVKKFFNLLNPPRHGLHGRLEEDEKVYL